MKGQRYNNRLKNKALKDFTFTNLEAENNDLTKRCKFNFSYFDPNQKAGQDFSELSKKQLTNLINSLIEFNKFSLNHWKVSGPLVMYNNFPIKTKFKHPNYIPHEVCWGRFRLGNMVRLVGFTVPPAFHGKSHHKTKKQYDKNTFYIVFIDQNHEFWPTKKK